MTVKPILGTKAQKHDEKAKSIAKDLLYVADGNNFLHRAKHATIDKPVMWGDFNTAIMRGFLNIVGAELLKFQPTHACIVFDGDGDGFRKEIWPTYKAQRESDDDLLSGKVDNIGLTMRESMNNLRDLIPLLGIKCLQLRDIEGDDTIRSVTGLTDEIPTIISTNDKDMLQLVNKRVAVLSTHWGYVTPARVRELLDIRPKQVVDYLALQGDKIDNYPGVKGMGPKTAAKLLTEFGTVRDFLDHVKEGHELFKWKSKIENSDFRIFRKLAKLVEYELTDPDDEEELLTIDDFVVGDADKDGVLDWMESFGIRKYSPYITKALGLTEGRVRRMF